MSSAPSPTSASRDSAASREATGDLSAPGRIVRAALIRFAQQGVAGATVRDIAADAGVSAALVIHHFGSKEALRRECDDRVVAFVRAKERASAAQTLDAAFTRYGTYAARMLAEDSAESRRLFDELLEVSKAAVADGSATGSLRRSSDPDAQAVALLLLGLAPFAFTANLMHWAGTDAESAMTRLAVPIAEIYTSGLMTDSAVLEAARTTSGTRS
jgi:AcrR family transcriptional regulator